MKKELLFSVTKSDCRWDYYRCPGKGGQKVNKTSAGVRCTHTPSKAVGQSCEHRSQHLNKREAFEKMAISKKFKIWHKMEVSRRTGAQDRIEREIEKQMKQVKVEIKEDGLWVKVDKNKMLDASEE